MTITIRALFRYTGLRLDVELNGGAIAAPALQVTPIAHASWLRVGCVVAAVVDVVTPEGLRNEVLDAHAEQLAMRVAEARFGSSIGHHDSTAILDDDDAVLCGVDQRPGEGLTSCGFISALDTHRSPPSQPRRSHPTLLRGLPREVCRSSTTRTSVRIAGTENTTDCVAFLTRAVA
jgi:hypothetical protein